MSVSTLAPEHSEHCLVLRPAFFADWQQTWRWYLGICGVTVTVALAFTLLGFWPVLAFAGVELTGLGVALYASARRSLEREVVRISDDYVEIEKGRGRPQRRWRLQRTWSEVVLVASVRRWAPPALSIRSRGQAVELGGFLAEEDRRLAARELWRLIGPMGTGSQAANPTPDNDVAEAQTFRGEGIQ